MNKAKKNTKMDMKLIDTHCHFNLAPFKTELESAITQFRQAKVDKIIVPAVDYSDFNAILDLTLQPEIYGALGFHPLATTFDLNALTDVLAQTQHMQKIVAIGEVGLDFHFPNELTSNEQESTQKQQIERLHLQCEIASTFNYPLILHVRKAHQALLQILKQYPTLSGVIHAFSGSYEQAMAFVRLGFYIGVGGIITYPRAQKTRQTIAKLPLSTLVLETDSPYMPIFGFQGQPNRPERLALILQELSILRAVEPESFLTFADQLYQNSLRCFPKLNA